jgi:hypothetical protein
MSARPFRLALVGLLALLVHATAADPAPPENLPAAQSRQVEDVIALKKKTDDAAIALRKWYESALDVMKKNALAKGDLDAVLATDLERQRMSRDLTNQEKANLPLASLQVRNQFDQARVAQAAQEKTATAALLRGYVATLEALEKRVTQKGDIDAALAIRKERTAAAQQLSNATPLPGDLLAAESPKPGATPAPSAATPVATPAATPASAKPPSGLSGAPGAPVLDVCPELNAFAYVETKLKNLVSFQIPPGGPVQSSKPRGVFLKNEPATGRSGTTWSFSIKRKAPDGGALIVHPLGNGHIAIHLRQEGLFVLSPTDFAKTPGEGGDVSKIKLTPAGTALFPLGSKEYKVVSQLSASGRYTISVDGAIIGTATFAAGPGLVMTKDCKGEHGADLPLRWHAGAAGLIAGGAERGGACGCKAVTFQASAPEPAP